MGKWASPNTKAVYPSGWQLRAPGQNLDLTVTPRVADQEVRAEGPPSIVYWEGACAITGTKDGKPVTGVGYTELSGYVEALGRGLKDGPTGSR